MCFFFVNILLHSWLYPLHRKWRVRLWVCSQVLSSWSSTTARKPYKVSLCPCFCVEYRNLWIYVVINLIKFTGARTNLLTSIQFFQLTEHQDKWTFIYLYVIVYPHYFHSMIILNKYLNVFTNVFSTKSTWIPNLEQFRFWTSVLIYETKDKVP